MVLNNTINLATELASHQARKIIVSWRSRWWRSDPRQYPRPVLSGDDDVQRPQERCSRAVLNNDEVYSETLESDVQAALNDR